MFPISSRKLPLALRRCRIAPLCCLVAGVASASADERPALKLDQDLQVFKEQVALLNRDLEATEQALLYPDQSRTTVYVSVKVGGFLLEQVSLRINEMEAVGHDYTDSEARALLKEGWHRLLRTRLEPGTHRLQARFRGRFFDAEPGTPPIIGTQELVFEKGLSDLDLILPLSRNTRLDKPALSEVSRLESRRKRPGRNLWLPHLERIETELGENLLGSRDDPRYRAALFYKHDGRYFSALTELLDIADDVPDAAALPLDYQWLLAEAYAGFGMEAPAERIYRQIAAASPDPVALARARLELVRFEYQRGYLTEAFQNLQRLREGLPKELVDDWKLLMVSTLLAQERYNEAAEMLAPDRDSDELPPVLRYNLGVALIKDGREIEGRRQLNRVGTMSVRDLDTLTLRDKANLTLGYQYLQAQNGKNAKAVFGRIRTEGPFSNRALLGLGWAEIAPPAPPRKGDTTEEAEGKNTDDSLGTLLRPDYVDPKARTRLTVETRKDLAISLADQEAMLRALVPWAELIKRDPMDPAVQEGMLAIPWILDRLQAYEQSLTYYLDAIAALEAARKRMDEAKKSIVSGKMVHTMIRDDIGSERGWKWRLTNLADTPETYFLQSLLAEHRFQEQLKNHRDALLLTRALDSWKTRLAELERSGPVVGSGSALRRLQRAGQSGQQHWPGTVVWLALATELGAPGAYDAPAADAPRVPLSLQTLAPPAVFTGALEQLRPLQERLDRLRPQTAAISTAQNRLLESLSLKELDGQKKQIERYLTEARFAVARIYDRQRKSTQ